MASNCAGGGAGRDGGTAGAAVVEADLDLDRGVASGVEDLAGYDDVDGGHIDSQVLDDESLLSLVPRPASSVDRVDPNDRIRRYLPRQ